MCVSVSSACIRTVCRRMDAAVKTSKCEAQINDIGQETIKEPNRVMKIREGDLGAGVWTYCFVSNVIFQTNCLKDGDPHKWQSN